MAMFARRALGSLSAVHRSLSRSLPALPAAPVPSLPPSSQSSVPFLHPSQLHSRTFRSSTASLLAQGSYSRNFEDGDKIDPDTIPFDGRDYKHWFIKVRFPDPEPTPEEMVRTYEEICAKGLNISVEEAKKRIYACSTTTYRGFQAVMTKAKSQQFGGIPGVVYVKPDYYLDPQNKDYGGDKYENGVITHMMPAILHGPRWRLHETCVGYQYSRNLLPKCARKFIRKLMWDKRFIYRSTHPTSPMWSGRPHHRVLARPPTCGPAAKRRVGSQPPPPKTALEEVTGNMKKIERQPLVAMVPVPPLPSLVPCGNGIDSC